MSDDPSKSNPSSSTKNPDQQSAEDDSESISEEVPQSTIPQTTPVVEHRQIPPANPIPPPRLTRAKEAKKYVRTADPPRPTPDIAATSNEPVAGPSDTLANLQQQEQAPRAYRMADSYIPLSSPDFTPYDPRHPANIEIQSAMDLVEVYEKKSRESPIAPQDLIILRRQIPCWKPRPTVKRSHPDCSSWSKEAEAWNLRRRTILNSRSIGIRRVPNLRIQIISDPTLTRTYEAYQEALKLEPVIDKNTKKAFVGPPKPVSSNQTLTPLSYGYPGGSYTKKEISEKADKNAQLTGKVRPPYQRSKSSKKKSSIPVIRERNEFGEFVSKQKTVQEEQQNIPMDTSAQHQDEEISVPGPSTVPDSSEILPQTVRILSPPADEQEQPMDVSSLTVSDDGNESMEITIDSDSPIPQDVAMETMLPVVEGMSQQQPSALYTEISLPPIPTTLIAAEYLEGPSYIDIRGFCCIFDKTTCNRSAALETFLPVNDRFKNMNPDFLFRSFKSSKQPQETSHESQKKYLADSIVPQRQINSIYHYNEHEVPSKTEMEVIRSVNQRIRRLIFSFGPYASFATVQKLQNSNKASKLWHSFFCQEFVDNLLSSLEFGFYAPAYNHPPDDFIHLKFNGKIEDTVQKDVVFFDDSILPIGFPVMTSFGLIKNCLRSSEFGMVLDTKICYSDLESLIPYERYELTFPALEAVIKVLTKNVPKLGTNKGYCYMKPDLDFATKLFQMVDPKRSKKEQQDLRKDKANQEMHLLNLGEKFDFLSILQFYPSNRDVPYEVVVCINYQQGKISVLSTMKTVSCKISEWHPIIGMQENLNNPRGLASQLRKLTNFLRHMMPKSGDVTWKVPEVFETFDNVEALKDDDKINNRLLMCVMVDRLTSTRRAGRYYETWKVGGERPTHFQVDHDEPRPVVTLRDKLNKAVENYYGPLSTIRSSAVKYSTMKYLFKTDCFYNWSKSYFKTRYFDILRHNCTTNTQN